MLVITKSLSATLVCLKLIGLAFLVISLQGCQDSDMPDLKQFVSSAYQDKKPIIEPLPEIVPFKGFEYSAAEENDPFNFNNIATGRTSDGRVISTRPDAQRRREPLEQFPRDALKLVGTLTKQDVPWVVVNTSEGTAHLATVGNYLGQNDGKIVQIDPDRQLVKLTETVLDSAGRWVTRDVEITIDE